jgi:dihydrofolate reductase
VGTVIMHNVVSVDGFIADENDDVGPLDEWYYSGNTPITEGCDQQFDHSGAGNEFKVSRASADYVRSMWKSIGTIVMGRHLFDLVNGWEGQPPAGDHVVVVSHRPKPEGWHPEASYHFVESVAAAIEEAQELAGERTVAVNAGEVGSQILAAGLVDEVAMDVVPVLFRSGKRFSAASTGSICSRIPTWLSRGKRLSRADLQPHGPLSPTEPICGTTTSSSAAVTPSSEMPST